MSVDGVPFSYDSSVLAVGSTCKLCIVHAPVFCWPGNEMGWTWNHRAKKKYSFQLSLVVGIAPGCRAAPASD